MTLQETAAAASGAVTAPQGYRAGGMVAGIKESGLPDLALLAADGPAVAAATFTTNVVKAAPLLVSQEHIRDGRLRTGGRELRERQLRHRRARHRRRP